MTLFDVLIPVLAVILMVLFVAVLIYLRRGELQ